MVNTSQINEHMEVVGSDNQHVGTVDHIDGQRIKLAKKDSAAGGQHHYLPLEWTDRVEAGKLCLNRSSSDAMREWQSDGSGRAS
jgi:hypothetical protein